MPAPIPPMMEMKREYNKSAIVHKYTLQFANVGDFFLIAQNSKLLQPAGMEFLA
jgi:hypothetical protein